MSPVLGKYYRNKHIDWNQVFKRNLKDIKENRLKQFNFKMLYNLIPTKRMLFVWKVENSDLCNLCKCREDLIHAFLECPLNMPFFRKLVELIRKVYNVNINVNIQTFLKMHKENDIDDILTIAFWSIYKMIILRNESGKDERKTKLWWIFLKEVKIRLDINVHFVKKGKPNLFNLPKELNIYV